MAMDELYWDPYDIEIDLDPYQIWQRMRDEAPLYRNEKYDFWALPRFADVEAAHRDPKTYSSAHGTVLEGMSREAMQTAMIIFLDPPEHTRMRSLVSRAFTPRRVQDLEGTIRSICRDLLGELEGRREFDYMQDFALQLPSRVMSTLFGVPESDREHVRHLFDEMFHIEEGVGTRNEIASQGHDGRAPVLPRSRSPSGSTTRTTT